MSIVAIQAKGFLIDGDSFSSSRTSMRQVSFVKTLATSFRVVILTSQKQEALFQAEHWRKSNGLSDEVVFYMTPMSDIEKLDVLRSSGSFVSFYIGSDPTTCRDAVKAGVPTLFFTESFYEYPEHREDVEVPGVTPWELVQQEAIQQQEVLPKGVVSDDE